jgi:hypothetical protein
MLEILTFLAALGCTPAFELVMDPALDRPGRQVGNTVRVRTNDAGVWAHELWHVCQYQKLGEAKTAEESAQREAEAHTVEQLWRTRDR